MGKVLSISRNNRELTRVSLTKQSLTIGRSPLCDVTLRVPGVTPVHYLLDWASEGPFNPEGKQQEWSLLDISSEQVHEKSAKSTVAGIGKIISAEPINVDDFVFKILDDKLHKTVLEGGTLHNSLLRLRESLPQNDTSGNKELILEIIRVAADSGTVTEVVHSPRRAKGRTFRPVKALPELSVSWIADDTVGFRCEGDSPNLEITQWRAQRMQAVLNKNDFQLGKGSFVQIDFGGAEYYFRIVPKINAPAVPVAWRRDAFLWMFLVLMFLSFGMLSYIKSLPRALEEKPEAPQRIATIEVEQKMEVKPPPPPPPPPPKEEEEEKPPPEPVKPKPPEVQPKKQLEPAKEKSKTPVSKMTAKAAAKPAGKPIPTKLPPKNNLSGSEVKSDKPDAHLNSPAPEKPVGAVGLLGALNSKKGRPSEVKADEVINNGVVSKTLSGNDSSNIVVKRNPPGIISSRNFKGSGDGGSASSGLMAASSRPGGGDTIKADNIGGISGSGRNNLESSIGMAGPGTGGGLSASGESGSGDEMDVSGGLDKESVRRTLAQYRRQIRTCYERALNLQKGIHGRIVYKWLISPNGPTVWVNLVRSEVESPKLDACVKDVIQHINWPRAPNKKETIVNYPFQFQSKH